MLSNVKQISGQYSMCTFFYSVLQLLSAAEDSLVRVWHLTMTPETNTVEVIAPRAQYKAYFCCWFTLNTHLMAVSPTFNFSHVGFSPTLLCTSCSQCVFPILFQVAHLHNECVTDTQICGAKFCDGDGYAFAVTGYDLSEIIRYTQT